MKKKLKYLKTAVRFIYHSFVDQVKVYFAFRKSRNFVTFFCSARDSNKKWNKLAFGVGKDLGTKGVPIYTGAGPGLMNYLAEGSKSVNGSVYGCGIKIKSEPHIPELYDIFVVTKYFMNRKLPGVKFASCFVILPGGVGTFEEFFEVVTLVSTDKSKRRDIVLSLDSESNYKLYQLLVSGVKEKLISSEVLDYIILVRGRRELVTAILKTHKEHTKEGR